MIVSSRIFIIFSYFRGLPVRYACESILYRDPYDWRWSYSCSISRWDNHDDPSYTHTLHFRHPIYHTYTYIPYTVYHEPYRAWHWSKGTKTVPREENRFWNRGTLKTSGTETYPLFQLIWKPQHHRNRYFFGKDVLRLIMIPLLLFVLICYYITKLNIIYYIHNRYI